jgi:hypothetical protein
MSIREELLQDHINMLIDDLRKSERKVERLTKAGDAMVDMVDWEVPYERRKKLEADWNAAKEGKPRA